MPLSPPSRNAAVPAEFLLSSYDFDLPEELIAQNPPELRGKSRLMLAGPDAPPPPPSARVALLAGTALISIGIVWRRVHSLRLGDKASAGAPDSE